MLNHNRAIDVLMSAVSSAEDEAQWCLAQMKATQHALDELTARRRDALKEIADLSAVIEDMQSSVTS